MRLNTFWVVIFIIHSSGVFAKELKSDKQVWDHTQINHKFQLKKDFEIDVRNKKVAIFNDTINCLNNATVIDSIRVCINEERTNLDNLTRLIKEQRTLYKIK